MKVLVIGSGGRDHAIAWKFAQSTRVKQVYVAHGNAGIAQTATCIDARTIDEMADFAETEGVDLTFVGPEKPLSAGIVDLFESRGLAIIGPNQRTSRLESSKCDAKVMLRELGIPVPEFAIFDDPEKARQYVRQYPYPVVVKADGLAAGKGSLVCDGVQDAEVAIHGIMEEKIFQMAGGTSGQKGGDPEANPTQPDQEHHAGDDAPGTEDRKRMPVQKLDEQAAGAPEQRCQQQKGDGAPV